MSAIHSAIASTLAGATGSKTSSCPGCGTSRVVHCGVGFPICKACEAEWGPFPVNERQAIMLSRKTFQQVMDERGQAFAVDVDRLHIPELFLAAQPSPETRTWARSTMSSLLITGGFGVGKTYAACGALRAVLDRTEGHAYMVNCASLSRLNEHTVKLYSTCTVLALDDLGARLSPAAIAGAYEIIDARHGNGRKTVVTSNMPPTTLMELDERIGSRLLSGTLMPMVGHDRRLS